MKKDIAKITINKKMTIRETMSVINNATRCGFPPGIALLIENKKLIGVVTDGDIRRAILRDVNIESSIENIVRQVVTRQLGGQSQSAAQRSNGRKPVCDMPNAATFKAKLNGSEPAFGIWITLESPSITEMAARMGFDWIVIDAEHGYLDMKNVMEHIRVANLTNTPILVRIAEIQEGLIKRIMDIGADGIVVPQVRTVE